MHVMPPINWFMIVHYHASSSQDMLMHTVEFRQCIHLSVRVNLVGNFSKAILTPGAALYLVCVLLWHAASEGG